MLRLSFFLLICLYITCYDAAAQFRIHGSVTDSKNNPIPYTSVYLERSVVGSVCDSKGKFELVVENIQSTDTLTVSSVGFTTKKIALNTSKSQHVKVILRPNVNQLNEVVIKPREFDAEEVWKKVLKHFSKNFEQQAYYQDGFYRELFSENNIFLKVNECSFNYTASRRSKKKSSKAAFNYHWNDYWHSSKSKPRYLMANFAQYWPSFISTNEIIKVVESRISFDSPSKLNESRKLGDPLAGPKDLLSLNQLRFNTQIFYKKLQHSFKLKDEGITFINGRECYAVGFYPINQDLDYHHVWSKKVRTPLYEGKLMIDTETFALVELTCKSVNFNDIVSYLDNDPLFLEWKYKPNALAYSLSFAYSNKEYWYLKEIDFKSEYVDTVDNKSVKRIWHRSMVLSEPKDIPKQVEGVEFPLIQETLRNRNQSYNNEYWAEFEESSLYKTLPPKAYNDLNSAVPLQKQFSYINRPIDDIVKEMNSICEDTSTYNQLEKYNSYSDQILNKLQDSTRSFVYNCYSHLNFEGAIKAKSHYDEGNQLFRDTVDNRLYFVYVDTNGERRNLLDITSELKKYPGWRFDQISSNSEKVVLLLSKTGSFSKKLIVKDISTSEDLMTLSNVNQFELLGNRVLISTQNKFGRSSQIEMIDLKDSSLSTTILFQEKNNQYELELKLSDSKEIMFISSESKQQNRVWYFSKDDTVMNLLGDVTDDVLIYEYNHFLKDESIYYASRNPKDFKVYKFDYGTGKPTEIYSSENRITDYLVHKNKLIFTEYEVFNEELLILDLPKNKLKKIELCKNLKSIELDHKITSNTLTLSLEGTFSTPTNYTLNLDNYDLHMLEEEVPSFKFEKSKNQFIEEVVWVTSSDRKYEIPVLLSYTKNISKNKNLFLQAYGAYESIVSPSFDLETIVEYQFFLGTDCLIGTMRIIE